MRKLSRKIKFLLAVSAGLAVTLFLAPVSSAAAVVAFVLVMLIYVLRRGEPSSLRSRSGCYGGVGPARPQSGDRFQDGLHTAERVLEEFSQAHP